MRKLVLCLHAGVVGTDEYEFYLVPEGVTERELDNYAWQRAVEHAESYGIYPRSEYEGEEDFDEDDDCYSDNMEGWWEEYVPSKHDGHTIGGEVIWEEF